MLPVSEKSRLIRPTSSRAYSLFSVSPSALPWPQGDCLCLDLHLPCLGPRAAALATVSPCFIPTFHCLCLEKCLDYIAARGRYYNQSCPSVRLFPLISFEPATDLCVCVICGDVLAVAQCLNQGRSQDFEFRGA